MAIKYRQIIGRPLSSSEVDENFRFLDIKKVNKENGKGLSDENFTLKEKNKLKSLQNADVTKDYVNMQDAKKVDKVTGKGLSTNDFTTAEKTKLANLINYVLPQLLANIKQKDITAWNDAKDKKITAFTITGDANKVATITLADGSTLASNFVDIDTNTDIKLNSLNFNKTNGVLTAVTSDGKTITATIDGRYSLLNHTHSYNDLKDKPDNAILLTDENGNVKHTVSNRKLKLGKHIKVNQDTGIISVDENSLFSELKSTLIISTTNVFLTDDLIQGHKQNGKHIIINNGNNNINVAIKSNNGFSATYQKTGTGNVTFVSFHIPIIQVDNTNVINGKAGSSATLSIVGGNALLRISNAE